MTLTADQSIMLDEANAVPVQKYKPKVTPHILDQIQVNSAARANKAIQFSQDAVAHSRELLRASQKALEVAQKLRKRPQSQDPPSTPVRRSGVGNP